jgi:hypothetical protein
MNEKGEEDGESQSWVRVVGRIRNEALWDFVKGDGYAGLHANGKERIGGHVMMVLVAAMPLVGVGMGR